MLWDSKDRRYEHPDGRPLTSAEIHAHIEEFIAAEKLQVRQETDALFSKSITVAEFFAFMRQRVTAWHGVAGQVAYGGRAQMSKEHWKRVNEKILSELEYLNKFAEAAENSFAAAEAIADEAVKSLPTQVGPQVRDTVADALLQAAPSEAESVVRGVITEALGDIAEAGSIVSAITIPAALASLLIGGTIEARAQLYSESTYSTYENNVLARETDSGVTLARRVLEPGLNCADCIEWATEEFRPIDEVEEIGSSICAVNCKCEYEFSDGSDSFLTSELFGGRITGQEQYGGLVELE